MVMHVHKFMSANETMIALTPDKSGSNLPADGAKWRPEGSFDIDPDEPHRFGYGSPGEIIAAIEKDGFWCRSTKCVNVSVAA
jgi:hypothetical protein